MLVYLFWMKSSDWSIFTMYSTVVRMSPLMDSSFSATIITCKIISREIATLTDRKYDAK